jgi:hypothetical protein
VPNLDLQAAVTSWVAQELEEKASRDGISYWASVDMRSDGSGGWPHLTLIIERGAWQSSGCAWPLTEENVRVAALDALKQMGLWNGN